MKNKYIVLLLLICLLITLSGCGKEPQYEKPVSFYYLVANLDYDAQCTAVAPLVQEGADLHTLEEILQVYFAGPDSTEYLSPFPTGLQLLSTQHEENTLYITVSDALADLSGLDLTIACCCITMTCLELSDAEEVCIQAETASLGGEKSITMNRDCLLLLDESN